MEIELKPQRYKEVIAHYDVACGYGPQLLAAQKAFGRAGNIIDTELNAAGVVKRSVFSETECAEINAKFAAGLRQEFDRDVTIQLFKRIFATDIDKDIISYFGSEYFPIGSDFYETPVDETLRESDGWHCDAGPSKHLIMAAYFTPSEADAANTIFLNKEITHYMKEAGYVFCNIQHRITHFDVLTDAMSLPRVPVNALEIKAGDVVVFDAPNLLHRRLIPKIAPRRLMMTALCPSFKPWVEVVENSNFPLPLDGETFPPLPGYAQESAS
ncbi:MAG: hypothetical protein HQ512_03920 [Rhodospirillales bacterium]|nr:hypothetical protein [Rhodospirillales bacterium]